MKMLSLCNNTSNEYISFIGKYCSYTFEEINWCDILFHIISEPKFFSMTKYYIETTKEAINIVSKNMQK